MTTVLKLQSLVSNEPDRVDRAELALTCLAVVAEPILVLDAAGRVLLANAPFERWFAICGDLLDERTLGLASPLSPAIAELARALAIDADAPVLSLAGHGRVRMTRRPLREGGLILTFRSESATLPETPAGPARKRFADAITNELLGGRPVAVLYLNLDRFKLVNDTLGHSIGDLLLASVVDRIRSVLGHGEVFERVGGDEFGIVVAGEDVNTRAGALADKLIGLIDRPALIKGHVVNVGGSIGIAVAPGDGTDAEMLVRRANLALYAAKKAGRGVARCFDAAMDEQLAERRQLEFELRRAVKLKEFRLHYQAQGDAETGAVVGFEALIRWQHPNRGLLSPVHFLDLAEEIGLMPVLGEWVIETACREAARWPERMGVAVNVSPTQFLNGKIVDIVRCALERSWLAPKRLHLEITETVLLNGTADNLATLNALRALGCAIAMDDFGTGYSSLSYLSMFPFDTLKLDKGFVQRMREDRSCDAIARTVAELGRKLGMKTIAEGVETEEQMATVREQGFDMVQGYLLFKPIPADRLGEIISELNQPA